MSPSRTRTASAVIEAEGVVARRLGEKKPFRRQRGRPPARCRLRRTYAPARVIERALEQALSMTDAEVATARGKRLLRALTATVFTFTAAAFEERVDERWPKRLTGSAKRVE